MSRLDPQALVDKLFALVLAPSIEIGIVETDGVRTQVTVTDVRMLLQRRRIGIDGDVGQWDTVIRINRGHTRLIEEWVAIAQVLDPAVEWRLAEADGQPTEQQQGNADDTAEAT